MSHEREEEGREGNDQSGEKLDPDRKFGKGGGSFGAQVRAEVGANVGGGEKGGYGERGNLREGQGD